MKIPNKKPIQKPVDNRTVVRKMQLKRCFNSVFDYATTVKLVKANCRERKPGFDLADGEPMICSYVVDPMQRTKAVEYFLIVKFAQRFIISPFFEDASKGSMLYDKIFDNLINKYDSQFRVFEEEKERVEAEGGTLEIAKHLLVVRSDGKIEIAVERDKNGLVKEFSAKDFNSDIIYTEDDKFLDANDDGVLSQKEVNQTMLWYSVEDRFKDIKQEQKAEQTTK